MRRDVDAIDLLELDGLGTRGGRSREMFEEVGRSGQDEWLRFPDAEDDEVDDLDLADGSEGKTGALGARWLGSLSVRVDTVVPEVSEMSEGTSRCSIRFCFLF